LLDTGYLPDTVSLEVSQANLHTEHPAPAIAQAQELTYLTPPRPAWVSAFSIDDDETLEVDDALNVTTEGELWRVDLDIADVAAHVRAGDPMDHEARRRATTVYLATGPLYMLPARLGCELASLTVGQDRPAMRTTVWLNAEAEVVRYELGRTFIRLEADRQACSFY
jgi:exoribonuclease II